MGKVQVKKVEVPQCGKLTCDFCLQDFVSSQVQLDPDAERALRTNLWDLYDGDEVATVRNTRTVLRDVPVVKPRPVDRAALAIARQEAQFQD